MISKKLPVRILILIYWPLIVLLCVYLRELDSFILSEEYKNWALAHIVLHALPIFIYITTSQSHSDSFPFIPLLGVFNFLQYGLPVFFIRIEDFQLGVLQPEALRESFYAYFIFYTTFYLFYFSKLKLKPVEFAKTGTNINVIKIAGYFLLLAYIFKGSFQAIYHLGYVGIYIYLGFSIYFWKQKLLKYYEKIIFVIFFVYEFLQRALDGLIAPLALLVMFVSLCVIISRSSKLIIVACVIVFAWFYSFFSVIKFSYREQVWYGNRGGTIFDRIQVIQTLSAEKSLESATSYIDNYKGKEHFLWRFSYQMSGLSLVLSETPRTVPYWNGESYLPLFSKFVPRFLWPDKPEEVMGYKFGTRYRIMSTWNRTTSFNTPMLAEMYMNFGFFGLYFGCFLVGFICFCLNSFFNKTSVAYASKIVGMALLFPLLTWESNFSLTYGNIFLVTLTLLLLFKLLPRFYK